MFFVGARVCLMFAMTGLATTSIAAPTRATESSSQRIQIAYGAPATAAHRELRDALQETQALERFRTFLGMLVLPKPLTLMLASCDGEEDAWYEPADATITLCYEYIETLRDKAPKGTTDEGVTPEDAVIGPVMEVVLHEVAHAVFHLLELPILGREEDAADQFAIALMMQMDKDTARRAVAATAHMYRREAAEAELGDEAMANAHNPPLQRFYTLLCLAYGWHPDVFQSVVDRGYLKVSRAEECKGEAEALKFAFAKLVGPHIDDKVRGEMSIRDWAPAARRMLRGRAH